MRVCIDAWLERREPLVRFIDLNTGEVLLELGATQVRQLLEAGVISPEDLAEDSSANVELYRQLRELLGDPHLPAHLQGAGDV